MAKKPRKRGIRILRGTGVAIALFLGFLCLLPWLLSTEWVRSKILASASSAVGGEAVYEELDLSYFPTPRLTIRQVDITIPGKVRGSVESVSVFPKLLPLFKGKLRFSEIDIESPDLKVTLPGGQDDAEKKQDAPPDITEHQTPVHRLSALAEEQAGLIVHVDRGKLELLVAGANVISLHEFHLELANPAGGLQIDAGAKANLADTLAVQASVSNLSPRVQFEVRGQGVDLARVRQAILALAGENRVAQTICDIVREGTASSLTLSSQADEATDLVRLTNLRVGGRIRQGQLHVPGVDLDLAEVQGSVSLTGAVLRAYDLDARLDGIHASKGTFEMNLQGEHLPFRVGVNVQSEMAALPPLLKHLGVGDKIAKELDSIQNLEGALQGELVLDGTTKAVTWRVPDSAFGLSADYGRLPAPLNVATGHFSHAEGTYGLSSLTGTIGSSSFSNLSAELSAGKDAGIQVHSGDLRLTLDELFPWAITLGTAGRVTNSVQDLTGTVQVTIKKLDGPLRRPDEWTLDATGSLENITVLSPALQGPLTVNGGGFHVQHSKDTSLAVKGNTTVQEEIELALDMVRDAEGLTVNVPSLKHGGTQAALGLALSGDKKEVTFSGEMDMATLNKMLSRMVFSGGRLKGDFTIGISGGPLRRFTARGKLEGHEIGFPGESTPWLKIEHGSMQATSGTVTVDAAVFTLWAKSFSLNGRMGLSDLQLLDAGTGDANRSAIGGSMQLDLKQFTYEQLTLTPLRARVSFSPEDITVDVAEAELFGVSLPGRMNVARSKLSLDFNPSAKGRDLQTTLTGLLGGEQRATGTFDLSSHMETSGQATNLVRGLQGNIDFIARDGLIHKFEVLNKIFGLLNVMGILTGNRPELFRKGIAYHSLTMKGDIKDGVLVLEEAVLDANTMTIAVHGTIDLATRELEIEALVAPLKTVDAVMEKVPLIKRIHGGDLAAVPIKVSGPLTDPDVSMISPKSIESKVRGILENIVREPKETHK